MDETMTSHRKLYTIGHGNTDIEEFIDRLHRFNIQMLVDVRSKPYSRHVPSYNKDKIKPFCIANRINYHYLGDLVGGKPDDSSVRSDNGEVDYSLLAQKEYFLAGIDKLTALIDKYCVCIMCAEGKPDKCHRNLLIAPAIKARGIDVVHILADGTSNDYEHNPDKNNCQHCQLTIL